MQTLKIPFLVCCLTFLGHLTWILATISHSTTKTDVEQEHQTASRQTYSVMKVNGGVTRFLFRLGRVAGIVLLLGISIISLWKDDAFSFLNPFQNTEVYLTCTYAYTLFLAIASLLSQPTSFRFIASKSVSLVLLVTWLVFAYRDIWPLATYTLHPQDEHEGQILWVKICLLTLVAVIIPLFIPARYVPVDPKNEMPKPSAEQTASLASFLTFTFMDPLIFLGSKVSHIPVDALPPLLDSDDARHLTEKGFRHLDPFKGAPDRHLFWGLFRTFLKPFAMITTAGLVVTASGLAVPVGLNRILRYLENPMVDPASDPIRPWFWILCLFLGPTARSISEEVSLYQSTQLKYHMKAVIMQLVFECGLRMRLNTGEGSGEDAGGIGKDGEGGGGKRQGNLMGRINNAVTTDADNVLEGISFISIAFVTPVSIIAYIALLFNILGWSSTVALVLTIVLAPLAGYIGSFMQKYEKEKMRKTDVRVQKTSEVVSVLRMVKLFGWERKMTDLINSSRHEELEWLRKLKILRDANNLLGIFFPLLTQWTTYATLTVFLHGDLVPSKIFSSLILFRLLRYDIQSLSWGYNDVITAKVSLDRIDTLLKNTELLDAYSDISEQSRSNSEDTRIGFGKCSFVWSSRSSPISTSATTASVGTTDSLSSASLSSASSITASAASTAVSNRSFTLRVPDDVVFKAGKLNIITGPTGCGKTSVLLALLGEMHFIGREDGNGWVNLPRGEGVAYAAQESWVLNATIRDNVLFGSVLDEERYDKVLEQCALKRDLELFEAGDMTEVGERGLTLSGGQKVRLTLARAVYSPAKIILLDDIFAALDVHTSVSIAQNCFGGDLVQNRTVILITHNTPLVLPMAELVLTMSSDGTIVTKEIDKVISRVDPELNINGENASSSKEETPSRTASTGDGKLILAEEVAEGKVTWDSIKILIYGLGGGHPFVFLAAFGLLMFVYEMLALSQTWFLGYWGSQYENTGHGPVLAWYYLGLYAVIIIASLLFAGLHRYYFMLATMKASESIHAGLVRSVLTSTLRWLDQTPTGRILARFTQDTRNLDGNLPGVFAYFAGQVVAIAARFTSILIFTPTFIVPGIIVACAGLYLGNMYLKAQLSTKREMSNALSPMLSHFSVSIHGLVSIRAYGAQDMFKAENIKRINYYIRISRPSFNLNRWIGIRIDGLGAIFTTSLAAYLVYGPAIGASNTGFILSIASSFTVIIYIMVRQFNNLQIESNSLERIQDYLNIDHEPAFTEEGRPPAAWPMSGDLRVEGLCARYSKTGPTVLHNLTFHIQSGQRVGVVGRTGSGKSSLTLALLRCIVTEGEVFYDGLPTSRINLEDLRSNITIIPQTPELLSGTLRQNLDPFGKEDDAVLNDALRSAGLYTLQEGGGDAKITLDSEISGGGANLSIGQRQILALARAILRRSKLLILDEATSAIDYKTDTIIQTTLRTQLDPDVTVITVAHRLQTIMDSDKIMVLDAGKLVEFDAPSRLLENPSSMLSSMVDNSKDAVMLRAMAGIMSN